MVKTEGYWNPVRKKCVLTNKPCFKHGGIWCQQCDIPHKNHTSLIVIDDTITAHINYVSRCHYCGKILGQLFSVCTTCDECFCDDHISRQKHNCTSTIINPLYSSNNTVANNDSNTATNNDNNSVTNVVIIYCKEKDGERCAEEKGIALPECCGCPNCTDPKVKKRRLEKNKRILRQTKSNTALGYANNTPNIYSPDDCEKPSYPQIEETTKKHESILKRLFKKLFW